MHAISRVALQGIRGDLLERFDKVEAESEESKFV